MQGIKKGLRGSTLVETLVMMLLSGVVFLTVMEGVRLFTRLQTQRAGMLLTAGRQRDAYFRMVTLVERADSILWCRDGVRIYRGGRQAVLSLVDSALVYRSGAFRDTLLRGVAALSLTGDDTDSLVIALAAGHTLRFRVEPAAAEVYRQSLEEIEKGYGCEE